MSRNNARSRNHEDTRNHLSLDLDVKRVRPIINQYESNRGISRQSDDNIVPSLGLHMLQTGGGRNGSADQARQAAGSTSQHQPVDDFVDRKENIRGAPSQDEYHDHTETCEDVKPQPARKFAKGFIIVILLSLHGTLLYSVYSNRLSDDTKGSNHLSWETQLRNGLSSMPRIIASIAASFSTKQPFPLVHLQKRLQLGQSLLNELNDPIGAHAACSSVANAVIRHFDRDAFASSSLLSSVMSVLAFMNDQENRLLAEALLCMGDAQLVSSPISSASALSVSYADAKNIELMHAKDALEAALSADPTNPAIRCSLGLAFLLVGVVREAAEDVTMYIAQSIQHLSAAVKSSKFDDAIHLAAVHNLGLAHLILDSLKSGNESRFLDLVSTLETQQPMLQLNKGSALLQIGKTDDAIASLNATSQILNCDNETVESRSNKACVLIKQNLALATSLADQTEASKGDASGDDSEQAVETQTTSDDSNIPGKMPESLEALNQTDVAEGIETIVDDVTEILSDVTTSFEKPATSQLQTALKTLENAASEGQPRPRLLLALAKARASMGDINGAMDATLTAINHAVSDEEIETLTTYLETLMGQLAGENSNESPKHYSEHQTRGDSTKRDRTVIELELSLEIERLKYRVLEQEHALKYQEMRLGGGSQEENDYAAAGRAIDYSPEKVNIRPGKPIAGRPNHQDQSGDKRKAEEFIVEVNTNTDELQGDADETNINSFDDVAFDSTPQTTTEYSEEAETTLSANDEVSSVVSEASSSNETVDEGESKVEPEPEPITLPNLFDPPHKPPVELSATAKSYMKIADAYLDKGKYALASKQFLKVIRKFDHLAAHLGYATALERAGKTKQLNEAALAYGNATRIAIIQGDKVDPLAKPGAGGMAESILRRALQIAQSASTGRLEVLRTLSTYAHTATLAADMYYAVGMELLTQATTQTDANEAFTIANEFIILRNDEDNPVHIPSTIEMGKAALEKGNSILAIEYFEKVKRLHLEDDDHVKLLVLSGKAHASTGDLDTAINELTRALSFPQCQSTATAHHELALALTRSGGESHEINLHFEKSLDLGMDPTDESIAALGEHNMSVLRSYNRQHWRQMNEGQQGSTGGIMSGGGVSSQKSVFAPQAGKEEEQSAQTETLSLLEQGAASYDGHVPMGGEIEGEGESNLSNLSGRKRA